MLPTLCKAVEKNANAPASLCSKIVPECRIKTPLLHGIMLCTRGTTGKGQCSALPKTV